MFDEFFVCFFLFDFIGDECGGSAFSGTCSHKFDNLFLIGHGKFDITTPVGESAFSNFFSENCLDLSVGFTLFSEVDNFCFGGHVSIMNRPHAVCQGVQLSGCIIWVWAVSSGVEQCIRIAQTAVRFRHGPQFSRAGGWDPGSTPGESTGGHMVAGRWGRGKLGNLG